MPQNINNENFNLLRTIFTAENASALKGNNEATQKVKNLFIEFAISDTSIKTEFPWYKKIIFLFKPLFYYLYFDSVLSSVNSKIKPLIREKFKFINEKLDSIEEIKKIQCNDEETLEDLIGSEENEGRLKTFKKSLDDIHSSYLELVRKIPLDIDEKKVESENQAEINEINTLTQAYIDAIEQKINDDSEKSNEIAKANMERLKEKSLTLHQCLKNKILTLGHYIKSTQEYLTRFQDEESDDIMDLLKNEMEDTQHELDLIEKLKQEKHESIKIQENIAQGRQTLRLDISDFQNKTSELIKTLPQGNFKEKTEIHHKIIELQNQLKTVSDKLKENNSSSDELRNSYDDMKFIFEQIPNKLLDLNLKENQFKENQQNLQSQFDNINNTITSFDPNLIPIDDEDKLVLSKNLGEIYQTKNSNEYSINDQIKLAELIKEQNNQLINNFKNLNDKAQISNQKKIELDQQELEKANFLNNVYNPFIEKHDAFMNDYERAKDLIDEIIPLMNERQSYLNATIPLYYANSIKNLNEKIEPIETEMSQIAAKYSISKKKFSPIMKEKKANFENEKKTFDQKYAELELQVNSSNNNYITSQSDLSNTKEEFINLYKKSVAIIENFIPGENNVSLTFTAPKIIEEKKNEEELKKLEVGDKNVNKESVKAEKKKEEEPKWNNCSDFSNEFRGLFNILVGDSLKGPSDVHKKPEGEIVYNLLLLGAMFFKKEEKLRELITTHLNYLKPPEKTKTAWLQELGKEDLKLESAEEKFDFVHHLYSLIFNQSISFSELIKDFKNLANCNVNFNVDKLSLLVQYTKFNDFYFSESKNMDEKAIEKHKKSCINLLNNITGINRKELKKLEFKNVLLLLDILRVFSWILSQLNDDNDNAVKGIFTNIVMDLIQGHKNPLTKQPINLIDWALSLDNLIVKSAMKFVMNYMVSVDHLKREVLGLSSERKDNPNEILFEIRDAVADYLFDTYKNMITSHVPKVLPKAWHLIGKLDDYRNKKNNSASELNNAINMICKTFFEIGKSIV